MEDRKISTGACDGMHSPAWTAGGSIEEATGIQLRTSQGRNPHDAFHRHSVVNNNSISARGREEGGGSAAL